MRFLNSGTGYELFRREYVKDAYVDKSMLIDTVYQYSQSVKNCIAVTRPRRFGKTVAANMIAAFFDSRTAEESRALFERLEIGKLLLSEQGEIRKELDERKCWSYQGKENVIRINMLDLITPEYPSYGQFFKALKEGLLGDLKNAYPNLELNSDMSLSEAFDLTGDQFIFVIDEWDAIFEAYFVTEADKQKYILFLRSLFKDKRYVRFVYMTGILPIAKYSSGSPLNMFAEFTAFQDNNLSPYFGLTRDEIIGVMERKKFFRPSIEELSFWYDGYIRDDGVHMYNPNSVSMALSAGNCRSYWTGTGPMNEVRDIISNNVLELREDVIRMAAGEILEIELQGFDVEKKQINTRDEILSAMVVYGFLTYHDQQLSIPNHELVLKFREALASQSL